MFYGRFSANTLTELLPQIQKTLTYQRYETPNPEYLGGAVLIAGFDIFWAPTHGNGQINYIHSHYFIEENRYTDVHAYLFPASSSFELEIRRKVSNGVGWVNYTAHGLHNEWSDPQFNINHVHNLQNFGKYPIVISNACRTSSFDVYESFAEAWLRARGGAVLYIGATNNTVWNEDFWWAVGHVTPPSGGSGVIFDPNRLGMYDMLFNTLGTPFEAWHISAGAMVFAGNMVVQSTSSSLKDYYWEIYCIKGDPSLVPFLGMPLENQAQYPAQIVMGQGELSIYNSAPFSRVGLSFNGILHGAGMTDENGNVVIKFTPITEAGKALIVITAQNRIPIIEYIQIIPGDVAFLLFESTGLEAVDFASQTSLSLTVNNIGSRNAYDVSFRLRSNSDIIRVLDGAVGGFTVTANTMFQIPDSFNILISSHVAGQTGVNMVLTASINDIVQWTMPFELIVNAPELNVVHFEINKEQLVSGEVAEALIRFSNRGSDCFISR
jgi:hypothetical protein